LNRLKIDGYVITEYHDNSYKYLSKILDSVRVESIYFSIPKSREDEEVFIRLSAMATERGIRSYPLLDEATVCGMEVTLYQEFGIRDSSVPATLLSVNTGRERITYLGSSVLGLENKKIPEICHYSSVLIMGSHGPTYKDVYFFHAPRLKNVIFLGQSINYCSHGLLTELSEISVPTRGYDALLKYGY
jgi:hypothetical protein